MIKQLFERRSTSGSLRRTRRGQSLVEFALSLPILLLIIAGLAEVGNFLVQYNRLQTAAREGVRFAAQGGSPGDVLTIVEQSSTDTLDVNPDYMSVWLIQPVVEVGSPWIWEGGSAADWGTPVDCLSGNDCALDPVSPSEVLDQLKTGSTATAINGTTIAIVAIRYEADTLLNLPFFQMEGLDSGRIPLVAYSVMTQEVDSSAVTIQKSGCSAYPIGILQTVTSDGGKALDLSTEGELYSNLARGTDFQFLDWIENSDTADLGISLTKPGNSKDSTNGYTNPEDPTDREMHRGNPGDTVAIDSTWITSDVTFQLQNHVDAERAIRLVIMDTPSGGRAHIMGFAVFRVNSFTSDTGLTLEFVRYDTSCGYE